jgi:hypothetical protein
MDSRLRLNEMGYFLVVIARHRVDDSLEGLEDSNEKIL